MKSMRLLALSGCVALAAPSFAQTFSNNWSFTDLVSGQTISGVVSGLHNGDNLSADGLTITITQSPYADLLGDYTHEAGSQFGAFYDQYSASDGVVTFANFLYQNAALTASVYFGTDPWNTFYPELVNGTGEDAYNWNVGTSFSAAADADVPEPASWAMMLGGFGLVGAAMRRKRAIVRFA